MADLEYAVNEAVATIILNRPERKNAFTFAMVDEWVAALREARSDDRVRAVVLTGAGAAFCSGIDLDDFDVPGLTPLDRKRQLTHRVHQVALALEDLDKPIIAAVEGVAIGAGLDMALMCDMRVVGRSTRLSEAYVRVGLVPGDGGCYWLPRLVGIAKALELLLTGDTIDGEEAVRIGLANRVVDDGQARAEAHALAAKIAAMPPVSVGMIKRATYQSARLELRAALDLISSHFAVITATEDSAEALAAFRERRPGEFHGR
jgi:enoyl-CoA hydratase/carnithine racemase